MKKIIYLTIILTFVAYFSILDARIPCVYGQEKIEDQLEDKLTDAVSLEKNINFRRAKNPKDAECLDYTGRAVKGSPDTFGQIAGGSDFGGRGGGEAAADDDAADDDKGKKAADDDDDKGKKEADDDDDKGKKEADDDDDKGKKEADDDDDDDPLELPDDVDDWGVDE